LGKDVSTRRKGNHKYERRRLLSKTVKIPALILALFLVLAGCTTIQKQTFSFAMGPKGSDFYALGEGICADLTAGISSARFNPAESGGSADNAGLLAEGSAQIALMTADMAAAAWEKNPELRAIAPLFKQALHIVATGTSGIRSLFDLKARRVSLGTEGSGTAHLAEKVVASANLELRDIQRQYLEPQEAFEQMKNGKLDACFVLAAPGSVSIAELARELDIVIVPLSEEAIRALTEDDAFSDGWIPAGCYKNQDEGADSVFVDVVVVCTSDLPESVAKAMVSVFDEKAEETLKRSGIVADRMGEIKGVPLHEGLESKKHD
jgi:TRAP transporter TAXI family solute receptor